MLQAYRLESSVFAALRFAESKLLFVFIQFFMADFVLAEVFFTESIKYFESSEFFYCSR